MSAIVAETEIHARNPSDKDGSACENSASALLFMAESSFESSRITGGRVSLGGVSGTQGTCTLLWVHAPCYFRCGKRVSIFPVDVADRGGDLWKYVYPFEETSA